MHHARIASVLLFFVCGCSQQEDVWRGHATLGDSAVRFTSRTTLRPVGQSRTVCITPANDAPLYADPVQLDVFLVRADGGKDRLGWKPDTVIFHSEPVLTVSPDSAWMATPDTIGISPPAPPRMQYLGGEWCAQDWNGSHVLTRYGAVEISSLSRIRITKIRWKSYSPML